MFNRPTTLEPNEDVDWQPGPHKDAIRSLGIVHLAQYGTDYPGAVYLTVEQDPERTGGMSPTDGRPLLDWLAGWLAQPDKADNVAKLAASNADERHLFLILPSFADAPFGVVDLLMRDDSPLPESEPGLPRDVTHLWMRLKRSRAYPPGPETRSDPRSRFPLRMRSRAVRFHDQQTGPIMRDSGRRPRAGVERAPSQPFLDRGPSGRARKGPRLAESDDHDGARRPLATDRGSFISVGTRICPMPQGHITFG